MVQQPLRLSVGTKPPGALMAAEGAERTTNYKRSGASYPQKNPIYKLSTIPERSLVLLTIMGVNV